MKNLTDAELAAYLKSLLPSGSLEAAIGERGSPGLEAADAASRGDSATGRRLLEKLAQHKPLDRAERFHLEAVILPDQRPAVDILRGDYQCSHPLWLDLNGTAIRDRLLPLFPAIGRVDVPGHPSMLHAGTGFVVGPDLLMTNRHVAELFVSGVGRTDLRFVPGIRPQVDLLRERDNPAEHILKVTRAEMVHPWWDMALLRVEGLRPDHPVLRLSTREARDLTGRRLVVVGYPAFSPYNPADVQQQVFGGIYGIKRLQPGLLGTEEMLAGLWGDVGSVRHDASTLGGNSGSCLIDLETGEVLGLHFAGTYAVANYAIPAGAMARDGRIADAGVSFSGVPGVQTGPWDKAWLGIGAETPQPRDAALSGVGAPVTPLSNNTAAFPGASAAGSVASDPDGTTRIVLPLEISVRIGSAKPSGTGATTSIAERAVEPFRQRSYDDRPGYDLAFLGVLVPMPQPRHPDRVMRLPDGRHEIPYHHFSIVMHRDRRLALITGANVDARPAMKRPGNRPAADYTRDGLGGLGENDTEAWFDDPRLPGAALPDRFYVKDGGAFDRGHVVRREDVAWGATYEEMRHANGDTFHVTNCSPQVAAFNQHIKGKDNWGDLENLVLAAAGTERLAVLAGPVLADYDPLFRGVDATGQTLVPLPRSFWKVIAAVGPDGLECFGFHLFQDLTTVRTEFAVPEAWLCHMLPLARIEDLAGIDFDRSLRASDQAITALGRSIRTSAGIDETPAPAPAPANADPMAPIADLLAFWRGEQGAPAATPAPGAVFVATLTAPVSDQTIAADLTFQLGLAVEVGPLFGPDRELDRFRRITIAGVTPADRADLFDMARAMRDILGADTVDPDLSTGYSEADPSGPAPEDGSPESADFAFWCWVPDKAENLPADPDWAMTITRTRAAWALSAAAGRPAKGAGIVIAQPDTGVVPTHPELPPTLINDPLAVNLVEPGRPPVDPLDGGNEGHGTATGSVAASPESRAMSGSAPAARLVPIRAIRSVTVFDQSRVAQAIDHARRGGAHVISLSLGGLFSSALHAALRRAVAENIIVVAAAGNCVGEVVWPARYDEAIAVAGVNATLKPWKGSCRGSAVDISGPAEFVQRADARDPANPGKVSGGQGTSFATAHLAGLAACWLAHHGRAALIAGLPPGVTLQALFRARLKAGARVPPGFDTGRFGAGVVDAVTLLQAAPLPEAAPEAAPRSIAALVRELGDAAYGPEAVALAAPAFDDPQSLMELACAAFDLGRARNTRRAAVEAMPPAGLSDGLRALVGPVALQAIDGRRQP